MDVEKRHILKDSTPLLMRMVFIFFVEILWSRKSQQTCQAHTHTHKHRNKERRKQVYGARIHRKRNRNDRHTGIVFI